MSNYGHDYWKIGCEEMEHLLEQQELLKELFQLEQQKEEENVRETNEQNS